VFHFNKKHLEDPTVPMWIVMAKGETYYVEHVDANIPWTTKETPDNVRTKGAIKFKECLVTISEDNCASITELTKHDIIRLKNQERGITRIITGWRDLLVKTLEKSNIKHGPIKIFSAGCGRTWYVCDIFDKSALSILGLAMVDKHRILMPNENYYKAYDDPTVVILDEEIDGEEDDYEDLYEE
jgi:hypothetical protein